MSNVAEAASPVFCDMFANKSAGSDEIHLDHTKGVLNRFLTRVRRFSQPRIDWSVDILVIRLALELGCDSMAREMLSMCSAVDAEQLRLDALALACDFGDLLSASRILLSAHQGEGRYARGFPLRPDSARWKAAHAARLSPAWIWSLTRAAQEVERKLGDQATRQREEKSYWVSVVGEFMHHLAEGMSSVQKGLTIPVE